MSNTSRNTFFPASLVVGILFLVLLFTLYWFMYGGYEKYKKFAPEPSFPFILSSGHHEFNFIHQGIKRRYIVHVPKSYTGKVAYPVVFVLHGGGGAAEGAQRFGFTELSEIEHFITVYADGSNNWNAGNCDGFLGGNNCGGLGDKESIDDVGYIKKTIADLKMRTPIDAKRVYVTGFSNGAMMAHRLACEMSDIFAAAAPVEGTIVFAGCNPVRDIPLLQFIARNEEDIPYEGGAGRCSSEGRDYVSAQETFDFWRKENNAISGPQTIYQKNTVHCEAYYNAGKTTEVVMCIIEPDPSDWRIGGHSWPGLEKITRSCKNNMLPSNCPCVSTPYIDATSFIWDFFKKYSL